MLAPLRDLAEGTRAVSRGNYDTILPVDSADELGVLVDSFNRMTQEISRAQRNALESQRRAESEHAYLDTVLTHLSAGVLSFNGAQQLRTCNTAAARILGSDLTSSIGQPINQLAAVLPGASALFEAIQQGMEKRVPEWQREVSISGHEGRQILILSGTRVDSDELDTGHVVVFEDATELLKAQRDAAWGEVARRLAHEIKNPLTPIQLSAERIRNKYLSTLDAEQREILDRSTRTIVQQVEAMKTMVNAFSEYARPAPLQRITTDLNQLITDTVELFRSGTTAVTLQVEPDSDLESIEIDPNSFRQVLNNLIINAQDALAGNTGTVIIRTEYDSGTDTVTLTVQDDGPGFDADKMDRIFEPYVSSKEKGTGLGLAICRRIVEEHGGTIRASNAQPVGAAVIISLPLRRR